VLFRVLGPVEVVDPAGAVLTLGPRKQRMLLAALLARGGERAATGTLVDMLWEGDPPRSATANLQTYVWELRKRLPRTRSGAPRVARDRDGYRLVLDDGDLDALSFTTLATAGRRALAAGETTRAAAILSDALNLWRGQPFEDVAQAVPLEARGLAEQRHLAVEDLLDARLRLGEHRDIVEELYRLTAADPLREPQWTRLMLALYRCGRRAEALHTYHDLRRMLDTEYGIQPGLPVREMHNRILADDPALLADPDPVPLQRGYIP
jgi:DNA-binding SARP family transcriptional activator